MKENSKKWLKMLGAVIGIIATIIGFISSVTGIASWLGITSLHWGDVIIPDPIIIVLSVLIAAILVVADFCLGGVYVVYVLLSWLARGFAKLVADSKVEGFHYSFTLQDVPVKTEKELEPKQVQTIKAE